MAYLYQGDQHKRKATGGRKGWHRKKRKYELGRIYPPTTLGQRKVKMVRVKGGGVKVHLVSDTFVNVYDPSSNKVKKVKILKVVENPSDREAIRKQIITKGAIVETEIGLVKVTSRPGQDGVINGILIQTS